MLRYSSGQAWPAVMKEWSVTGGFIDSHSINKTCELCDNEGLRYQFQITNVLTHYSLWVGSTGSVENILQNQRVPYSGRN